MNRILCAGLLALGALVATPLFAAGSTIKPGRYDAMMLAVTPDHQVQGYYLEELGEGVSRRCTFYLQGAIDGPSPAPITTWRTESLPGSIAASDKGVVLTVARGDEHPGCSSVLGPMIGKGLPLQRIDTRPWIGLVSIAADKAYLLKTPGSKAGKRPYIIKNDVVGVLEYKDGWARVEYVNGDDRSFKGWIRADQFTKLAPPQG